jgi:predicted lipoprotein with Yx(FWY)xxD motif
MSGLARGGNGLPQTAQTVGEPIASPNSTTEQGGDRHFWTGARTKAAVFSGLVLAAMSILGVASPAEAAPAKPKTITVKEGIDMTYYDDTFSRIIFQTTGTRTGPYRHRVKPPKGAETPARRGKRWWVPVKAAGSVTLTETIYCPDGTIGGYGEVTIKQWPHTKKPLYAWGQSKKSPKSALKNGAQQEQEKILSVWNAGRMNGHDWWYDAQTQTHQEATADYSCPAPEGSEQATTVGRAAAKIGFSASVREQLDRASRSAAHLEQVGYRRDSY